MCQNPTSLCARVLKTKYFPYCDVLHAKQKEGMSYTWRSIPKGIELLNEGVVWRIGSGESVKIWEDPCLPRGITRKPITPRGQALLNHVSDLIDPVSGQWDVDLVQDTFCEEDARIILALPVYTEMEDVIAK